MSLANNTPVSSWPAKMVDSGAHTCGMLPSRHQDETGRPECRVD